MLKIDIEGDASMVLDGANRLLQEGVQVVQIPLRSKGETQGAAIDMLQRRGYVMYALVPGPMVLRQVLPGEGLDAYHGNLLAVHADSEASLARRRILWRLDETKADGEAPVRVQDVIDGLAAQPWIAPWKPAWSPNAIMSGWDAQRRAVALAVAASDEAAPPVIRLRRLRQAMQSARESLAQSANGSRLFTAARIANDLGLREEAVRILDAIAGAVTDPRVNIEVSFREPFLLPMREHEGVGYPSFCDLINGAAIESRLYLAAQSAFFMPVRNPLVAAAQGLAVRHPRTERIIALNAERNRAKAIVRF
jgi:hypothetical protein